MPSSNEPVAPELNGYLLKLKRKTNRMTSNWNRRFFYVDPDSKKLGYKATRDDAKFKAFIYLDDITAVTSFDDMNFQVSSPERNFFLRADSQASAMAWVQDLEEYRLEKIAYDKAALDAKISKQLKKKKSTSEDCKEFEAEEKNIVVKKKKSKQRIIKSRKKDVPEEKSERSTRSDVTVEVEWHDLDH